MGTGSQRCVEQQLISLHRVTCVPFLASSLQEKAAAQGVTLVTFDEALALADFHSLHMPLTAGTKVGGRAPKLCTSCVCYYLGGLLSVHTPLNPSPDVGPGKRRVCACAKRVELSQLTGDTRAHGHGFRSCRGVGLVPVAQRAA